MENNQNIEQFDALLKQSLENAQVPVPSGVWQSVGTAIGTKATVAAKISVLKILALKYIAATIVSGAVIWGVYEIANSKSDEQIIEKSTQVAENTIEQRDETFIQQNENTQDSEKTSSVNKSDDNEIIKPTFDTTINNYQPESAKPDTSVKHNADKTRLNPKKENINNIAKESENLNPENEISKKTEESTNSKQSPDNKYSSETIVIPNAFTPYEVDGYNDCYKINIENEVKFVLQIFDNNNKLVFEATDKNSCWNGTNRNTGEMCPKGAYSFKLIYELNTGYKKTERGLINLF